MYKRMLVPLDGSQLSGAVSPHAILLVENKYINEKITKETREPARFFCDSGRSYCRNNSEYRRCHVCKLHRHVCPW